MPQAHCPKRLIMLSLAVSTFLDTPVRVQTNMAAEESLCTSAKGRGYWGGLFHNGNVSYILHKYHITWEPNILLCSVVVTMLTNNYE